jgi:hypothetical protein
VVVSEERNVQTPDLDVSASPRVRSEAQLLAQLPDPGPTSHEVAIKIWLPELVARLLKSVTDYEGVSQSSWVRERLYGYLYGQAALLARRIRAKREGIETPMFSRKPVDRSAGRWVYKVPQLGKNTIAFKVWVSQQMRDDLEILANHAGSGYRRLCARLLWVTYSGAEACQSVPKSWVRRPKRHWLGSATKPFQPKR